MDRLIKHVTDTCGMSRDECEVLMRGVFGRTDPVKDFTQVQALKALSKVYAFLIHNEHDLPVDVEPILREIVDPFRIIPYDKLVVRVIEEAMASEAAAPAVAEAAAPAASATVNLTVNLNVKEQRPISPISVQSIGEDDLDALCGLSVCDGTDDDLPEDEGPDSDGFP